MTKRILVVGGYGNFGSFIVHRLAREPDIGVIVAGPSAAKARALADAVGAAWVVLDIFTNLDAVLRDTAPDILIHTSGPFQDQGYDVARACIRAGVHYLDLADGRAFVAGIGELDAAARAAGVLIASGASSVPALTSAVVFKHKDTFRHLDSLDYGIATAQKTNRGLATVRAVLGYAGKPFTTLRDGAMVTVFGWQDLRWRRMPGLGWRPFGNCDVPDLELFPRALAGLQTVRFRAGLELPLIHLGLWAMTWLVRMRLLPNLKILARPLLFIARLFDVFGTDDSGFFMEMSGTGLNGERCRVIFELTAKAGDGLMIPCTPAVVLALDLARGRVAQRGAVPCIGLVGLDALLEELGARRITWRTLTPARA